MIRNIERFLQLLLLLLLPTQLSYHFWPSWSLVHGIRVDYLSPTLYLTDLLILALFLFSRFRVRVPLPVIIFAVLNILTSFSPFVTIYSWLRLLEYFWLFKFLVSHASLFIIHNSLSMVIVWTSLLTWLQFLFQRSVGGPLYWLGERTFNIGTPGIATISVAGRLLLRPYATLPHPNALAGFLLVAGLLIYYLRPKSLLSHFSILISALTIPITFSRTAIVIEFFVLSLWLSSILKINKIIKVVIIFLLASSIYYLASSISSPSSLPDRLALNEKALLAIKQNWLTGLGLGNFIPASSSIQSPISNFRLLTQPVHNIYLLLAAELGLPAFLVICCLVIKNLFKIKNLKFKIPLLVVLLTGAVDHYWLTLHQNQLLFTILIALIVLKFRNDRLLST